MRVDHIHNFDRVLFPSNQLACTICDEIEPPMHLFQLQSFVLPSGRVTHFKIECDVLTMDDWRALARLGAELLPPFGAVEGVPRGGMMFAEALQDYITPESDRLLIADDVWVTGLSMERHRAGREAMGIVAFTRGQVASWVFFLFNMAQNAEALTYQLNRPYGVLDVGN